MKGYQEILEGKPLSLTGTSFALLFCKASFLGTTGVVDLTVECVSAKGESSGLIRQRYSVFCTEPNLSNPAT